MLVIPAIDIRGGKVVRLAQGRADMETVYADAPVEFARRWAACGVGMIHVVDLDGAFDGEPRNLAIVRSIAQAAGVRVELGGGIRSVESVRMAVDAGAAKVVIGTRALDARFLDTVLREFGDRIVVGIDASAGMVRTKGWVAETNVKAVDLARTVAAAGVRTINYTDISRDGMLEGPNLASLRELLAAVDIDIVAAGGVSAIEDVARLKALEPEGLAGMIIGKALYEGRIELAEAVKISRGPGRSC